VSRARHRPSESDSEDNVRSIIKTLDVLEALSRLGGAASIGRLSTATQLPKSTLTRVVRTLSRRGYVRQASPRADYCLTSKIRNLALGFTGISPILEVGTAPVDALTKQLLWPAAIANCVDGAMAVQYSTMAASPYSHARSTLGKRLPLLTSAHGKAWLSALNASDYASLVDASSDADVTMGAAEIARVETRGFAMRTPGKDRTTNSLATPIRHHNRVVATVGLTFFSRAVSSAQIEELGVQLLHTAAIIQDDLYQLMEPAGHAQPCANEVDAPPIVGLDLVSCRIRLPRGSERNRMYVEQRP
jgi:IclR family mhp operon transcriptional activator